MTGNKPMLIYLTRAIITGKDGFRSFQAPLRQNNRRWALSLGRLLSVFVFLIASQSSLAKQLDKQQLAAVSVAINVLLLGELPPIDEPAGERFDLLLSNQFPSSITVTDAAFVAFDRQAVDVEFCFDVSSNRDLLHGDIVVEVNGVAALVSEGKDNCYSIPRSQQRSINYVSIAVLGSGITLTLNRVELSPQRQSFLGLQRVTRGQWNERAVRKVLKIFAFGGHAQDHQIQAWADMDSLEAIREMLTFDQHNLKLSPLAIGETYTETETQHGTLREWSDFLGSRSSHLPIPEDDRSRFVITNNNLDETFIRMATVRGLNPFRQRIGFWETNYHLATNLNAGVSRPQMARYFDVIMNAHAAGLPYHEVMGAAAKSAAVAEQYGHKRNEWSFDRDTGQYICECNDDFAREVHQLFFGIFGEYDPIPSDGISGNDFHENVTIPNTARMLTGMPVLNDDGNIDDDLVVDFGTNDHYEGNGIDDGEGDAAPLVILGQNVSGADASAKIDNLMQISIEHPESLNNLPVMIISVLADDNLSTTGENQLRNSWASMPVGQKNLLQFIQAYAISTMFHGPNQIKYLTSHERAIYIANKHNLDNLEAYFGGRSYDGGRAGRAVTDVIDRDNASDIFRPLNNVFGGQTGLAAADSALAFESNYNILTDREDILRNSVLCTNCDLGGPWEKKWPTVLPQRADGKFYVADIAPWLWNHVVGSMDNYTDLERAHLYSLLGAARMQVDNTRDSDFAHDFNLVMCVIADYQADEGESDTPIIDILTHTDDGSWDDYCREGDDGGSYLPHEVAALNAVFTGDDIRNDAQIQNILAQLGQVTLDFDTTNGSNNGADVRRHTRERVNGALGFIFTTPFVFVEAQ